MICTPWAMESEMDVAFDLPSIQFYKQFDSVGTLRLPPISNKLLFSGAIESQRHVTALTFSNGVKLFD